jgi:hypothetical protein
MSRCIESLRCRLLETATKQHAGEHLTFSEHPQAELKVCDVRNAARGPVVVHRNYEFVMRLATPGRSARCCKKAEPVRQVTDSSSFDEVRQRVSLRLPLLFELR